MELETKNQDKKSGVLSWRRMAVAVIAVTFIGGVWAAPASAHIGTPVHLWQKHLLAYAKSVFYTKSQAKSLFRNQKTIVSVPGVLGPNGETPASAYCPAGYLATGGGADADNLILISDSFPNASEGWTVYVANLSSTTSTTFRVWVVCLRQ